MLMVFKVKPSIKQKQSMLLRVPAAMVEEKLLSRVKNTPMTALLLIQLYCRKLHYIRNHCFSGLTEKLKLMCLSLLYCFVLH